MFRSLSAALLLALLLSSAPASAQPFSTAWTYQGQIKLAGSPVDATADFQFSLWDAAGNGCPPTGGAQLGTAQAVSGVSVTDGLFTVTLNAGGEFGASAFDGNARWLQVAVRSPAGSGAFATLCPRQPVTPAPYALYAASAPPGNSLDSADGGPVDALFVNATGSVGIGTTTPRFAMTVQGRGVNSDTLQLRDTAGANKWHLSLTGGGLDFVESNVAANRLYLDAGGNVGIGTNSPDAKLDVAGTARMGGFQLGTSATAGHVLTADANGLGTWQAPSTFSGWGLSGNAATNPATQFLGTTDNVALNFRVNNQRALRLEPKNIGIASGVGVLGGYSGNTIGPDGVGATVFGGGTYNGSPTPNQVNGIFGAVGGGANNIAGNDYAVVSGGNNNTASGGFAAVGGGHLNTASGLWAWVGGGQGNRAAGNYSAAAGHLAKADHNGSFVWSDNQGTEFSSTAANQFIVRAGGGVGIGTNSPMAALDVNGETRTVGLSVAGTFQLASTAPPGSVLTSDANGVGTWQVPALRLPTNSAGFNVAGTSTWTAPAGVTAIVVQVWGAGGGGGTYSVRTQPPSHIFGGGAGGGGGYSRAYIQVTPGHQYEVVVGVGGTGGAVPDSDGQPGGDSSLRDGSGSQLVVAYGGEGGRDAVNAGGAGGPPGEGDPSAAVHRPGGWGGNGRVDNPTPAPGGWTLSGWIPLIGPAQAVTLPDGSLSDFTFGQLSLPANGTGGAGGTQALPPAAGMDGMVVIFW